ncbi:oxidoreductase FAD-binding domain protein [Perkinsela sp. CCAP 1560/4]|nr:oxidoreductase FAD-binding domain protein [Perkinsela sp. CCAP 1560/4]|eukprot:KNH09374.1 oxidoreductase FAD-binding domain protein [Perkinsela sp. CCAP 1560/4]
MLNENESEPTTDTGVDSNFLFSTLGIDFRIDHTGSGDQFEPPIDAKLLEKQEEFKNHALAESESATNENGGLFPIEEGNKNSDAFSFFENNINSPQASFNQAPGVFDYMPCYFKTEELTTQEKNKVLPHSDPLSNLNEKSEPKVSQNACVENLLLAPPETASSTEERNSHTFICGSPPVEQEIEMRSPVIASRLSTDDAVCRKPQAAKEECIHDIHLLKDSLMEKLDAAKLTLQDAKTITDECDACIITKYSSDIFHLGERIDVETLENTRLSLRNLIVYGPNAGFAEPYTSVPLRTAMGFIRQEMVAIDKFLREV